MKDNPNIEDVTNSPKDWEDFWHSPEKYGTWQQQTGDKDQVVSNYVDDVLSGKKVICKRESPLSE
jgi:hypothetical protein